MSYSKTSIDWRSLNALELKLELNQRGFDEVSNLLKQNVNGIEFSKATPEQFLKWGISSDITSQLLLVLGNDYVTRELENRLIQYKQEHVIDWLRDGLLSLDQSKKLCQVLHGLDLQRIETAFNSTILMQNDDDELSQVIEPPDQAAYDSMDHIINNDSMDDLELLGMKEIASGRAAVVILGGGQGTRLGFDGPKGMYDINLPSNRSLFQLYAQRIVKLQENVSASFTDQPAIIPLFIMTSPLNHATTRNYFLDNGCFGLDPNHVHFFEQGTLPTLSAEGKIMMQSGSEVSLAPDGNGGIFNALDVSGILTMMENTYQTNSVHVFSVDNVMCKVADPIFIGYCLSRDADVGNKVVWKKNESEKVGVVAKKNGKLAVVEYSELSETMANNQKDGKFVYGAGNICNHYFSVPFLRKVVNAYKTDCTVMPYHFARKKIPYADPQTGLTIQPNEPNATKLEAFIFDCFSLSSNSAILEVDRSEEFGPVKNAPGSSSDSPDTARRMLMDLHMKWATNAGAKFNYHESAHEGEGRFEISPLLSYAGEGLETEMSNKVFTFTATNQFFIEPNNTMFCVPCFF